LTIGEEIELAWLLKAGCGRLGNLFYDSIFLEVIVNSESKTNSS